MLSGTITLDETVYHSQMRDFGDDFFDRLCKKMNNESYFPWFVIPKKNAINIMEDLLLIDHVDQNFDTLFFSVKHKNIEHIDIYFGPAETAEEADLIWKRISEK